MFLFIVVSKVVLGVLLLLVESIIMCILSGVVVFRIVIFFIRGEFESV